MRLEAGPYKEKIDSIAPKMLDRVYEAINGFNDVKSRFDTWDLFNNDGRKLCSITSIFTEAPDSSEEEGMDCYIAYRFMCKAMEEASKKVGEADEFFDFVEELKKEFE